MNIAEVRGALAVDGIQLNQRENQWHALTFAKVLIGSSKIQQAAEFTRERNGWCVSECVWTDQLIYRGSI